MNDLYGVTRPSTEAGLDRRVGSPLDKRTLDAKFSTGFQNRPERVHTTNSLSAALKRVKL